MLREHAPWQFKNCTDAYIPKGWKALVLDVLRQINELDDRGNVPEGFSWLQIKEKYGGLRMYHSGSDAVEAIVDRVEELSEQTCQICGNPGSSKEVRGWISTLCPWHYEMVTRGRLTPYGEHKP